MSEEKKYYCFCSSNCKYETMTKEQILAAIAQAVEGGAVVDPNAGFITKVKETNGGGYITFWVGRQSQYNAIEKKDASCLYIITDETTQADFEAAIQTLSEATETAAAQAAEAQKTADEAEGYADRAYVAAGTAQATANNAYSLANTAYTTANAKLYKDITSTLGTPTITGTNNDAPVTDLQAIHFPKLGMVFVRLVTNFISSSFGTKTIVIPNLPYAPNTFPLSVTGSDLYASINGRTVTIRNEQNASVSHLSAVVAGWYIYQ